MVASASFISQYRCAVYLNNAATTFLARGDYVEACLRSKECLSLIESIVRPSETFENVAYDGVDSAVLQEQFVSSNLDLSKTIQHVDKRLATTHTKTTESVIPIEILCYDGSLDSRRTLLEQQTKECWNLKEVAMPIWISDVIVDEIDDADELQINVTEIVPAIMLLNYAISHLCYYKCSNCQSALVGSLRLLQMSAEVLCIHDKWSSFTSGDIDKNMNFTEGRLFVAMAILSNMKCILVGRGNLHLVSCTGTSSTGSCSSLTSTCQQASILLSHEIVDDLAALQKICDEWIAYSRSMHVESLYCMSNASAA